jgi:hypothetical protein
VPSNVFVDFYVSLAVRKRADCRPAQWHSHVFANAFGQIAVGGAAKNFQFRLEREHGAANLGVQQRPWQSSKLANSFSVAKFLVPPIFSK